MGVQSSCQAIIDVNATEEITCPTTRPAKWKEIVNVFLTADWSSHIRVVFWIESKFRASAQQIRIYQSLLRRLFLHIPDCSRICGLYLALLILFRWRSFRRTHIQRSWAERRTAELDRWLFWSWATLWRWLKYAILFYCWQCRSNENWHDEASFVSQHGSRRKKLKLRL